MHKTRYFLRPTKLGRTKCLTPAGTCSFSRNLALRADTQPRPLMSRSSPALNEIVRASQFLKVGFLVSHFSRCLRVDFCQRTPSP